MAIKHEKAHQMLKHMLEAFALHDSGLAEIDIIPLNCTLKTLAEKKQVVLLLPVYGNVSIVWSTAKSFTDGAPVVLETKKIVSLSEEEEDILTEAYMWLCMENKIR